MTEQEPGTDSDETQAGDPANDLGIHVGGQHLAGDQRISAIGLLVKYVTIVLLTDAVGS